MRISLASGRVFQLPEVEEDPVAMVAQIAIKTRGHRCNSIVLFVADARGAVGEGRQRFCWLLLMIVTSCNDYTD